MPNQLGDLSPDPNAKNYLIVQNNVVINLVEWDGDVNTWQPPADSIQLVAETTKTLVWLPNADFTDFVLTEQIGNGSIGYTWDGEFLTTNQPKPIMPVKEQPISEGTQTL